MKILILSLFLVACASGPEKVKHENLKTSHKVVSASTSYRPIWISYPDEWAKKNHKKDKEHLNYRYYSYETEPMLDRDMACSIASAKVKKSIASQINSDVTSRLSSYSTSRIVQSKSSGRKQLFDDVIKEKVSASVSGVETLGTYWEKRVDKESDASLGHTCASFVRISKDQINRLVQEIQRDYK